MYGTYSACHYRAWLHKGQILMLFGSKLIAKKLWNTTHLSCSGRIWPNCASRKAGRKNGWLSKVD